MTVVLKERFLQLGGEDQENEVIKLVQEIIQSEQKLTVTQLKGGITNQLLLVEQENGTRLLVRAFGKGTDNFIDRKREFAVHNQLQRLGLAPRLYGQFGNGLVYGYVPGRITEANELNQTDIMRNVARRLAQWHSTLKPEAVARELETDGAIKPLGDFWVVMEEWVNQCPEGVLPISLKELKHELVLLKESISRRGGVNVMGHGDLLSANILVPASTDLFEGVPEVPIGVDNPEIVAQIRSEAAFIDYEYAIPCPRAFDIANHFQEWQGYECDKSRVPKPTRESESLVFWCEEYLRVYHLITGHESSVDDLLEELRAWWGMPGFYWGVWSAIQSRSSDIDFGYHEYASNRFQEFLDWKQAQP